MAGVLALLCTFLVVHCFGIGEELPEIETHLSSPFSDELVVIGTPRSFSRNIAIL